MLPNDSSEQVPEVVGDLRPTDTVRRETRSHVTYGGAILTRFVVLGPHGAVTFTVRTGGGFDDLAYGIDSHRPEPAYPEFQVQGECDLLPGGKCYADGSSLQASELWEAVKATGDRDSACDESLIWRTLEDRYARWIEDTDDCPACIEEGKALRALLESQGVTDTALVDPMVAKARCPEHAAFSTKEVDGG